MGGREAEGIAFTFALGGGAALLPYSPRLNLNTYSHRAANVKAAVVKESPEYKVQMLNCIILL